MPALSPTQTLLPREYVKGRRLNLELVMHWFFQRFLSPKRDFYSDFFHGGCWYPPKSKFQYLKIITLSKLHTFLSTDWPSYTVSFFHSVFVQSYMPALPPTQAILRYEYVKDWTLNLSCTGFSRGFCPRRGIFTLGFSMEDVDILLNLYLSKFQYLKIIILSKLHTFLSTDVYTYIIIYDQLWAENQATTFCDKL